MDVAESKWRRDPIGKMPLLGASGMSGGGNKRTITAEIKEDHSRYTHGYTEMGLEDDRI